MKRALVVDDESDARDFARAILEAEGWEVSEAEDGTTGIQQATSLKPELIILDVQMPHKSGFDVFTELSKNPQMKDTRVIMLTGVAEKTGIKFSGPDMAAFIGKEPDAYIEKPIDPESFKRIVKKVFPSE